MDVVKPLILFVLLSCLLLACQSATDESKTLDTFQIPEGFQLELIASEPLVSDPVDMEIDEEGRLMVVEMHGYPLDLSGSGVVKELIDTDDDGLPDKSIVFADGLVLPTGIMKWKTGWIVTDPPHVLFLEDTDQDGRADVRDTLLVGFARSNPQHNVNSPVFGLDNWIYLSHEGAIQTKLFDDVLGDEGEEVRYFNQENGPQLPRNADGLAVRFKPDSYELETLSARGQFGQTFDSWGHHFVTSNADHLFHIVMDAKHTNRNADLVLETSRHYMPAAGKGFELYPTTISPEHQLLTDIGVITSACGILWYDGGLFPAEYDNTMFTAEPVHNLIHVDKIKDDGVTFASHNLLEGTEFLSSSDSWFRPVNHYLGPDGAIYILDYHRKVIEHPEWLSDDVTTSGDLTAGTDKGRIYRLSPKGSLPMSFLNRSTLSSLSIADLMGKLEHENIWWRRHAQRLLLDKKDMIDIQALKDFLLNTESPEAKVHAAWLLEGMQSMDAELISSLLRNPVAGVRENAVKIAEDHLIDDSTLMQHVMQLADDPDLKVRFQVLLALGNSNLPDVVQTRQSILLKDITDPWIQLAALSASDTDLKDLFDWARIKLENNESPETAEFFGRLAEMIIRRSSAGMSNTFIKNIFLDDNDKWYTAVTLDGVNKALSYKNNFSLLKSNEELIQRRLSTVSDEDQRDQIINLLAAANYFKTENNRLVLEAKQVLGRHAETTEYASLEAVNIIGKSSPENYLELLMSVFLKTKSKPIRLACMDALSKTDRVEVSDFLIQEWDNLSIAERNEAVLFFLKTDASRVSLLDNIKNGLIHSSCLSWPQTVSLLNSSHPQVRPLARSLLQGSQLRADDIWNQFEPALSMVGSAVDGTDIFKLRCGICHQRGGENGIAFGPDLASVRNRNKAALLLDILQPNRAIADGYELYTIDLNSGKQLVGVISEESSNSITVRDASGEDSPVLRSDIESMTVSELSAMQEGIHTQLSVEEMADLLTYLKKS